MKIFYLILIISNIKKTLNTGYDCERLNKSIDVYSILFNKFKMVSLNLKNFNQFSELTITCANKASTRISIYIQINPNNGLILDDSLNLTGLEVHSNHLYIYISLSILRFYIPSEDRDLSILIGQRCMLGKSVCPQTFAYY